MTPARVELLSLIWTTAHITVRLGNLKVRTLVVGAPGHGRSNLVELAFRPSRVTVQLRLDLNATVEDRHSKCHCTLLDKRESYPSLHGFILLYNVAKT